MIIGIIGYFTVPSVANYIVHAGGGSALGQKVTSLFGNSVSTIVTRSSNGAMVLDSMGNSAGRMSHSMASSSASSPYFNEKENYMGERLKGN
jgi:hypothetical protein